MGNDVLCCERRGVKSWRILDASRDVILDLEFSLQLAMSMAK